MCFLGSPVSPHTLARGSAGLLLLPITFFLIYTTSILPVLPADPALEAEASPCIQACIQQVIWQRFPGWAGSRRWQVPRPSLPERAEESRAARGHADPSCRVLTICSYHFTRFSEEQDAVR